MKSSKRIWIFAAAAVVIVLLIGTGVYFWTSSNKTSEPTSDAFGYHALKLNGEYVSQDIFKEEQNKFFEKWSRNADMLHKTDEERNDLLLDEIIKRVVVEYYLNNKSQINITSKEIDSYINKYIKARYASMGGIQAYMDGMGFSTEEEVRKYVELYLKRVKYFSKVAAEYGYKISDSDMEKEYQKQKLENTQVIGKRIHILIKDRGDQAALKLATDLYNRLKSGEDFVTLAKKYSEDDETKGTGGVMDGITGGIYSEAFDKAVFNASPKQLIPPVNNIGGYDIVYVEKLVDFYHPKDEYEDMLITQKFGESDKFNQWLEKAKASVSLEITDPAFKAYRFFKNKQYTDAGKSYKEAFDKTEVQLYLDKASESYKSSENWDKVIEINKIGMKKYADQATYYLDSAQAYYKKKDMDKAKELIKKAEKLAEEKDSIIFKQQVANMYSEIGMTADAERVKKEIPGAGNNASPTPGSK